MLPADCGDALAFEAASQIADEQECVSEGGEEVVEDGQVAGFELVGLEVAARGEVIVEDGLTEEGPIAEAGGRSGEVRVIEELAKRERGFGAAAQACRRSSCECSAEC